MNIFEMSEDEILEKFETKEFLENLPNLSYDELQLIDIITCFEVSKYLNANGYSSLTVCPECHIDDFTHIKGCPKIFGVSE